MCDETRVSGCRAVRRKIIEINFMMPSRAEGDENEALLNLLLVCELG